MVIVLLSTQNFSEHIRYWIRRPNILSLHNTRIYFCLTKWKSIWLEDISIAVSLSQNNKKGSVWINPSSEIRPHNQIISKTITHILPYSASVEDLEIILCFLTIQDSIESPSLTTKPVIDLLVSGHLAQSELQKATILRELEVDRKIPKPGVFRHNKQFLKQHINEITLVIASIDDLASEQQMWYQVWL